MANSFIEAMGFKPITETENGAKAYSSTGCELVNQFGMVSDYMNRTLEDVFSYQERLWREDSLSGLRFPFYLRIISRKINFGDGNVTEKMQKGAGLRDETFKRLLWLAANHKETFVMNLPILVLVGSWKDLFTLLWYDKLYETNVIDKTDIFRVICEGLKHEGHTHLIRKFMPRIKSNSKLKTERAKYLNQIAKELAKYLKMSYEDYNSLKSSGKGHTFQQLITKKEYDKIDWNTIPGRALMLLANSKFITNHKLEKSFMEWIRSTTTAKFTGYPHELIHKLRDAMAKGNNIATYTLDAQFNGLVEEARKDSTTRENVLVCLDTSGSMNCRVEALPDYSCIDIALALAFFFAEINTGDFHNTIMMFDDYVTPYKVTGETLAEKIRNLPYVGCGGTNFQGVVEQLVQIRRNKPEIPLEDYPTTILVVSDMQFNEYSYGRSQVTNYEGSLETLKLVFPEEWVNSLKFIWWNCSGSRGGHKTFEGDALTPGCIFASGFDGNLLNLILGMDVVVDEVTGEKRNPTAEEVAREALSQEILELIKI